MPWRIVLARGQDNAWRQYIGRMDSLVEKFQEYSSWRFALTRTIDGYRSWLASVQLLDREIEARIDRLKAQLAQDRLTIAFVAEFSRGKSELINAIFFADYGK